MICDKCKKNNATFHSSVNINGNVTQTHLCEMCAKENKLFSINDFLTPSFEPFNFLNEEEVTCNKCGHTLTDFVNTGFLGCANCYKVFEDVIYDNLLKIQPATVHTGKKVNYNSDLSEVEQKIKLLELKLKQAVNEENYELAGQIKKQIIALKEGCNNE